MKNLLIFTLIFISFSSCNHTNYKRNKANDFIPKNTSFALTVNNPEAFYNDLKNNTIIPLLNLDDSNKNFQSYLSPLKHLKTVNDIVIAISPNKAYHLITKYNDSLFIEDTINIKNINTFYYKKNNITRTRIENDTLYNSIIDSFFVASNSKQYIEKLIDNPRLNKTSNNFKQLKSKSYISIHINEKDTLSSKLKLLGNHTILNMDLSQDNLSFSGITKTNDSSLRIINYLSNTNAKQNQLAYIIPNDSKKFLSYTFDDFSKVATNHDILNGVTKSDSLNNIQDLIIEIGLFDLENTKAVAIRSIDAEAVNEFINHTLKEKFREIEIKELDTEQDLKHLLYPLLTFKNNTCSFTLGDFIIFTESIEDAQKIISNYTNKSTLGNSDAYKNAQEHLSNESSILYYRMSSELDSMIVDNLPKEFLKNVSGYDLKKNHSQIIQVINDNGFAHVNMRIQPLRKKVASNSVSEEFNTTLDNDLLNNPQVVKNHITGQKDIVVQDIENNLYLISNRGKILWKKKINGNILGNIKQVDIYKNGRFQLIFATPNAIYVLDRNGKNVAPFPMKFSDEITQPLSVFDYDKKKNYRFLVVQGKNILMYNSKGKKVNGFNFKSASNTIKTQPKHFRVGSKDYIVFADGKKMYILNRKGQPRVTPKESIDVSSNAVYLYKGHFTVTNNSGQLVQVDQKGYVSKQNLLLTPEHYFSSTSKTLATLSENKLTIKSKSIELDFGDYTAPKIFYLKDKIYVSVTDLQTQKIYLFDSQAKSIPNFPVYGNSSMELDNFDKDRNLEFVIKGDNNSIILYQIN